MEKDLTAEEREWYRKNIANYPEQSLKKILDDMEKQETKRGPNGFPLHAAPLRTSSGTRFGW